MDLSMFSIPTRRQVTLQPQTLVAEDWTWLQVNPNNKKITITKGWQVLMHLWSRKESFGSPALASCCCWAGLQFIALVQSLGLCFCGFALLSYFSLSVTILLELAGFRWKKSFNHKVATTTPWLMTVFPRKTCWGINKILILRGTYFVEESLRPTETSRRLFFLFLVFFAFNIPHLSLRVGYKTLTNLHWPV